MHHHTEVVQRGQGGEVNEKPKRNRHERAPNDDEGKKDSNGYLKNFISFRHNSTFPDFKSSNDFSQSRLFLFFLSRNLIETEENIADRNERSGKNTDPHQNTGNAELIEVQEEVGVNEGSAGGGNENGGVKLQDHCLNEEENGVANGESNGNERIIPSAFLAFAEQKQVSNVHNGENHVEYKASDSPVCLRITVCRACEHNIEYKEGQEDAQRSDKLQYGGYRNVAIILLFRRLDQGRKHNTDAKEIADVGKVYVEIPTDHIDVIKDTERSNAAHQSECAINCVKNELCRSVFNHDLSPLIYDYNVFQQTK